MKSQKRPFVVEVRRKRGTPKRSRSIWEDVDFAAAAAELTASEERPLAADMIDDGELSPVDVEPVRDLAPNGDDENTEAAPNQPGSSDDLVNLAAGVEQLEAPRYHRRRHETPLPRGQRWKQRLPKILQTPVSRRSRGASIRKRSRSGRVVF